ncbi:MAG: RNA polymerase sigma factor [Chthoniobacterales bacterium]
MIALMEAASTEFETLVRQFEPRLFSYAMRIIGDSGRAHDVVQEVFVQLEKRLRAPGNDVTAKWLYTVCRHRALNVVRKERRLAFVTEEVLDRDESSAEMPPQQLQHKEAAGFLLRIVSTLPPRQQEVLQLRFQNDLSYQEISDITELTVSNVGVLIHTALKTLRQKYALAATDFVSVKPPRH